MDYSARILNRRRQRQARREASASASTYQGYNAEAGGHVVKSADGSVKLAEQLNLEAIALNEPIQFIGGSFE